MNISLERVNQFLLLGILLVIALVFGSQVIKPVILSCLLAMLMAPVCSWLEKIGFNRTLSSLTCVLVLLTAILGILFVVITQFISFSEDMPEIEKKANVILNKTQEFVKSKFDISKKEQMKYVNEQLSSFSKTMGTYAGGILSGITSTIASIILMLVFTFLLLFSKEKYETFFVRLYKEEDSGKIKTELAEIAKVSQAYLGGRVISMTLQAVIFSAGLYIIGIKNAILLGCIAALLTILPYIGTVIGGMFPILMSVITEDNINTTIWVIALLVVIQTLDNYFIEPNVVGGKVHLNALFTILIILIGGLIWGAVGMILFTPMLGMVKIIFSHVESLQPYAYLIGDEDKKEDSQTFSSKIKQRLTLRRTH